MVMAGKPDGDGAGRLVVGTFQVKLMLSDRRELTINGHVYSDDTKAELDARVDMYQDVADRQAIRADVVNKEAQVAQLTMHIEEYRGKLEELTVKQAAVKEGKGNGISKVKLTSQELQILAQGNESIHGLKKQIDSLTAAIATGKKKLEIAAPA